MNIVNDILVNTLFPDTDFVQTLDMDSVVPKYVENQEKGNPSVCKNCAEAPFRDLHIYGRSEQVTTTGAQLFDAASIKKNDKIQVEISDNSYTIQMTTTINESGSPSNRVYIAINHVIEGDFSGKTVTLSYDGVNSDVPNERYVIGLMYNTDDGRTHYLSLQKDMPKSISVTLPENTTNLTLRLFITEFTSPTVPAGTYTVTIQGAMLTEGSEKKDWEPYTGGKPSPSPDYPQEIVSAGKDGNLNVMVRGKNIFPGPEQPETVEKNGLTFSYKDGMYTLVGTSNTDTWFNIYPNIRNSTSTADTGETIRSIGKVAVANGLKNESCIISIRDANKKDKTENVTSSDNKKHLSFDTDGAFIYVRPGTYSETFTLMIVDENQAEDYEPYHEPQSMSVTTPNGLPGIPVTSGGNYTDENGQQWICDEVDLGRGVYVRRIASFMINDKNANDIYVTNLYTHVTVAVNARIRTPEETSNSLEMRINRNLFCEALPWIADEWSSTVNSMGFVENGMVDFTVENSYLGLNVASTNDERKAALVKYFTDKPCQIVYRIATPIETPLTAAEIAAYKSLRSYRGTTIVEAEDKAGISVKYNMPMPKLSKNGALRRWFKRHPII